MSNFVDVSVIAIWALLLVLAVLVLLLYRQFGLLYLGSGKRVRLAGLRVGAVVPNVVLPTTDGELNLGSKWPGTYLLLLFGGPLCTICEALVPQLEPVAQMLHPQLRIVFVDYVLPNGRHRQTVDAVSWSYSLNEDDSIHRLFDVEVTPFAFLIGPDRKVLGKNLVNRGEDIITLARRSVGNSPWNASPRPVDPGLTTNGHERRIPDRQRTRQP